MPWYYKIFLLLKFYVTILYEFFIFPIDAVCSKSLVVVAALITVRFVAGYPLPPCIYTVTINPLTQSNKCRHQLHEHVAHATFFPSSVFMCCIIYSTQTGLTIAFIYYFN
jgi:hypothetical protein